MIILLFFLTLYQNSSEILVYRTKSSTPSGLELHIIEKIIIGINNNSKTKYKIKYVDLNKFSDIFYKIKKTK
jgi:hypothetical protein